MRAPAGYTLIEVVVALGLLSIVMLGAAALIVSSAELGDRAVRSIRDPDLEIAVLRLRRDVQTATGLDGAAPVGWTDEPLLVRRSDAGVVAYGFDGGSLRRWTWEPDGTASDPVVVLRGVTTWRWRCPGGSAVDVQLERSRAPSGATTTTGTSRSEAAVRRETWRFAMRAAGAGGW